MFEIGTRVKVLSEDKAFVYDTGTIKEVTLESDSRYATYEITLDESKEDRIFIQNEFDRIIGIDEEIETNLFSKFIQDIIDDRKKLYVLVVIVIASIGGIYFSVKQHHMTQEVVKQFDNRSQIQIWTDEMAELEKEKATHYERQKYLREEDDKEIKEVKKLDTKINKLKDKIHLYVKPSKDDTPTKSP